MRNRVILASVVALVIGLFSFNLAAQVIPRSIQEGGTDAVLREKKNAWTVGIVGGLLSGTYMRFVDEMASVLNDGDNLRILPIVSYGAASNLDDLLYLRGVDAAVTQSDVFEYFRTQRKTPNLERRVQYVIRNCTFWRAATFSRWRISAARRSTSVRPAPAQVSPAPSYFNGSGSMSIRS
jgi:hypothetical protein